MKKAFILVQKYIYLYIRTRILKTSRDIGRHRDRRDGQKGEEAPKMNESNVGISLTT